MRKSAAAWVICALILVAAAAYLWPRSRSEAISASPSQKLLLQVRTKATSSTTQASQNKSAVSNLYSPLSDAPPVASSADVRAYNQLMFGWLTPDLNGQPLTVTYDKLAQKAANGDADAALALYRDLNFCRTRVPQSADLEQQFIESDTDALRDKDIQFIQAAYRYCVNLTTSQKGKEFHWLWLAAKGGNLDAQATVQTYSYAIKNDKDRAQAKAWIENAADHGNLNALRNLTTVAYSQHDSVDEYAYFATIYLLTRSPVAAQPMYKLSQSLSPFQIQQAEEIATKRYTRIIDTEKGHT